MQVILIDKVGKLGDLGDVVKVKDGYARNYLIPTGRARRATQANMEAFAAQKAELERVAAEKLSVAHRRAEKHERTSLTIGQKALDAGGVEFKHRADEGKGEVVPLSQVRERCLAELAR